jgi:hypothetical protein
MAEFSTGSFKYKAVHTPESAKRITYDDLSLEEKLSVLERNIKQVKNSIKMTNLKRKALGNKQVR